MQTNYNLDRGNLYGQGTETPCDRYLVPQYKGKVPSLGYKVERSTISENVYKFTLQLLDQAGLVAEAAKRLAKQPKDKTIAKQLGSAIAQFEKHAASWDYHRQAYAHSADFEKCATKIVNLTSGIAARNKSTLLSSILKVALTILVSGGSLVGGAVLGGKLGLGLIAFGGVVLVGSAAYAIYKLVMNRNSKSADLDAARQVIKNIRKIQGNDLYEPACDLFKVRMAFKTAEKDNYLKI